MAGAESDHEGTPGGLPVVVPDDASSLEGDRQAWLAEERARRRRARLHRMIFTRHWDRFGLSGPFVVIALLIPSFLGGIAVILLPRQQRGTEASAAPLAAVEEVHVASQTPPTTETPGGGVLDHRLPAVMLDSDVRPISSTDLRPAVIVATATGCRCTAMIKEVFRQAREFRLAVWLVGAQEAEETTTGPARNHLVTHLVSLDEQGTGGGARWAVDSTGVLTKTLVTRGTTLIAVRADGRVAALRRDMPLDPAQLPTLEPLLATLIMRTGYPGRGIFASRAVCVRPFSQESGPSSQERSGPLMTSRRPTTAGFVLGLATVAMVTSGCNLASPTAETTYAASDGTNVELGDVRLDNFLVVAEAKDKPGVVIGAVTTQGAQPVQVRIAVLDGQTPLGETTVRAEPGKLANLASGEGSSAIRLSNVPVQPGANLTLRASTAAADTEATLPVLLAQNEYQSILPSPS